MVYISDIHYTHGIFSLVSKRKYMILIVFDALCAQGGITKVVCVDAWCSLSTQLFSSSPRLHTDERSMTTHAHYTTKLVVHTHTHTQHTLGGCGVLYCHSVASSIVTLPLPLSLFPFPPFLFFSLPAREPYQGSTPPSRRRWPR